MKKIFVLLPLLIALSIFSACQKQETDAERQAEVDREVQRKLDAEHQAQEKDQLTQRQSELDAREKELADKENASSRERETRSSRAEEPRAQDRPVATTASYDTFYSKLDPHGDWIETSNYGYVFQPRQAQSSRNWRPYTDGRWVYTDVGWTWISEEPFGWATYHYGRWTRLRNVGWVWVPGDEWAPAWVSWRKSDNYVGWAPLPPEARFDRRSGIHNWSDNYYDIGPDQYCFVETKQFGAARVERTIVPAEQNVTIVNQTTNVTNITYNNTTIVNQGPNYDELRTRTQQPIERLRIERDVNVNVNVGEPRTVVRGEAVVIPAPLIARAQAVERPRTIKQTIANVVVERGWEANQDRQAVEKVRAKMKAEATPPPDAPSKTFVKASQSAAADTPPNPLKTTSAPPMSPAASTPVPEATAKTAATTVPKATRTATAPSPVVKPTATPLLSPSQSVSPGLEERPRVGGKFRSIKKLMEDQGVKPQEAPSIGPESMEAMRARRARTQPVASPAVSATVSPNESPASNPKHFESQAQKMEPRRIVPMESSPSPSATVKSMPAASPSPASDASAPMTRYKKRELKREDNTGEGQTSPLPTATPVER